MPIPYTLFPLEIHNQPDVCVARVHSFRTAGEQELIDHVILHGVELSRPDIAAVLQGLRGAIEDLLVEGYHINTSFGNFRVNIRGSFDGRSDSFDPDRHRIEVTVSANPQLRGAVRQRAQVVKERQPTPQPDPCQYRDLGSGQLNSILTTRGLGQLDGYRLKFDPADPQQGIFFVMAGREARVEEVARNRPAELIFRVPLLAAGTYTLEVRSVVRGGRDLRCGTLDKPLTVP